MKKLISALAFLLLTIPCSASIIIVDDDWPYDFDNIQDAIAYSSSGDFIIVFPGTYTGPGNRDIDFLGKAITVRSIAPTDPYFVAQTIIDCNGFGLGFYFGNREDANSVLDGLTITNASDGGIYCEFGSSPKITNCIISNNIGPGIDCTESNPVITNCTVSNNNGAGIYCYDSNSVITNCTITGNSAGNDGGGIFCLNYSSPTITGCTISGNSAQRDGGGIFCRDYSSPTITNCTITGNSAENGGGGISCLNRSSPVITNCSITDNSAYTGGGICCEVESRPTITNCKISGNSAGYDGGGILYLGDSSLVITNCTITGNSAQHDGGGILSASISKVANCTLTGNSAGHLGGGIYYIGSSSVSLLTNCIAWGNADSSGTGQSAQAYCDPPNVWFSCVQDDNPDDANIPFGEDRGNIDDDPCFVNPGFRDVNGFWHDGDYHLLPASPCIETGDPYYTYHAGDVDMDAQPRLMGQRVDIGADEVEISVIVVTKPQAGDVWVAGSTHEIKWDSFSVTGSVDISYSDNNGTDWVIIENSVTNTGSFTWLLPGAVDSNFCLISVEPTVPVPNFTCINSGIFMIHPVSYRPPFPSKWKSLGGNFDRSGLSQNFGPEVGCVKWQFHTDAPVSASPTINLGGRVHLACEDGKLYTLNANGQFLWSYDTNSPLLSAPTVGRDNVVYVGNQNGKLYAINLYGSLRWTHTTDGPIYSSPAVSADGNVFACSQDGTLYALGRDGSELWTFKTGGVTPVPAGAIFASPAIGPDGTIYIAGLYDPNLYALDPNTGSVKWACSFADTYEPNYDEPTNIKPRPFASPVVAPDGTIYQALLCNPRRLIEGEGMPSWYNSKLYAIDPNNGNIIWATNMTETATQTEEENPQTPEPNYWFKKYYYDSYTDIPTKELPPYPYTDTYWNREVLRYYRVSNSSWSEPVLAPDGTIYVSFGDQYLRAVDPDGAIKWVTSLGWFGGFTMTVGSDGLIYAASDDGFLYVVDPDGKEIARFEGDDWLSFPVITADNSMIVCDANNTVWAIGGLGCQGLPAALHRPEDLNADWAMNFSDFAVMAAGWLDCTDTSFNPAAEGAYCGDPDNKIFPAGDINRDQYVDSADLADLANRWLNEE